MGSTSMQGQRPLADLNQKMVSEPTFTNNRQQVLLLTFYCLFWVDSQMDNINTGFFRKKKKRQHQYHPPILRTTTILCWLYIVLRIQLSFVCLRHV